MYSRNVIGAIATKAHYMSQTLQPLAKCESGTIADWMVQLYVRHIWHRPEAVAGKFCSDAVMTIQITAGTCAYMCLHETN